MLSFPISIRATETILNPWYTLPSRVFIVNPEIRDPFGDPLEITPPCCVELNQYGIRMFFQDDQVGFVFAGNSSKSSYCINPIRYFLTYKTFVNYSVFSPIWKPSDEDVFKEVDTVRFKVERIVRVENERQEGEKTIHGFYHEGREEWLEISVGDLVQYLNVLNPTLYYAIAFYLIGCENPRYFLIEFYKAVESVKHAFNSESDFFQLLRPYGVVKRNYKEFTKTCNDMRMAPLDIGRHAPKPNAPLYTVDLHNLLIEPRLSEVFESATVLCRKVIDAYTEFLTQSTG